MCWQGRGGHRVPTSRKDVVDTEFPHHARTWWTQSSHIRQGRGGHRVPTSRKDVVDTEFPQCFILQISGLISSHDETKTTHDVILPN